MDRKPLQDRSLLFVCTGDTCRENGAWGLYTKMRSMAKKRGLKGRVRVCSSRCMDTCEEGPNVVMAPGGTMCTGVARKDAIALLDEAEKVAAGKGECV